LTPRWRPRFCGHGASAVYGRRGLTTPLGVVILTSSTVLAVIAGLDIRWDGQEVWLLLWGLAAYFSVAVYVGLREGGFYAALHRLSLSWPPRVRRLIEVIKIIGPICAISAFTLKVLGIW
jgi:hypothetical protein